MHCCQPRPPLPAPTGSQHGVVVLAGGRGEPGREGLFSPCFLAAQTAAHVPREMKATSCSASQLSAAVGDGHHGALSCGTPSTGSAWDFQSSTLAGNLLHFPWHLWRRRSCTVPAAWHKPAQFMPANAVVKSRRPLLGTEETGFPVQNLGTNHFGLGLQQ